MSGSEETWVPLGPSDMVFNLHPDGNVVVAGTRASSVFGAIVRRRAGQWMKRTSPLVILTGPILAEEAEKKNYKLGSSFV